MVAELNIISQNPLVWDIWKGWMKIAPQKMILQVLLKGRRSVSHLENRYKGEVIKDLQELDIHVWLDLARIALFVI